MRIVYPAMACMARVSAFAAEEAALSQQMLHAQCPGQAMAQGLRAPCSTSFKLQERRNSLQATVRYTKTLTALRMRGYRRPLTSVRSKTSSWPGRALFAR